VLSTWGTTCRVDNMQLYASPREALVCAGMVAGGKTQTIDGTLSVTQQASQEERGTPAAGMTTPCAMR